MPDETRLSFELYRTDTNGSIDAQGLLVFHEDDGTFEGSVDLQEPIPLSNAGVHGSQVSPCGDLTVLQLVAVDSDVHFKLTLLRNPYEPKVSYAGSAEVASGIYSISAVVAGS